MLNKFLSSEFYKSKYPRKEMYNGKVINKVPIVCLNHSRLQI